MGISKSHILIVDEARLFRTHYVRPLKKQGYRVTTIETVDTVLLSLAMYKPDIVLIDVTSEDVASTLDRWRTFPNENMVPIIKVEYRPLSPHQQTLDPSEELSLIKPFSIEELINCVQRLEKRLEQERQAYTELLIVHAQALSIDLASSHVLLRNRTVHVTRRELKLLKSLFLAQGNPVSCALLLSHVYSDHVEHYGQYSMIRGLVRQLRQKIEDDFRNPQYILTVPRIGYRLNMSP